MDFSLVKGTKKTRYRATEDGGSERNTMFPLNPGENWGPKRKHGTLAAKEEAEAAKEKKAKGA